MNRSYFLKKRISEFGQGFVTFVIKSIARLYKLIFTKRTILFVTNQKIRSVTVGPFLQVCLILFISWVGNLFVQSWRYDEIIGMKVDEISKLRSVNAYFQEEFESSNDKLKKISEYLSSISSKKHLVKAQENPEAIFKQPKNFKESDLSKDDKHTFNQVKDVENNISGVRSLMSARIKEIEDAIEITGLNIKKTQAKELQQKLAAEIREISLNGKRGITKGQGGPLVKGDANNDRDAIDVALKANAAHEELEKRLEKAVFTSEVDHLITLEKLVEVMPLSRPIKNYYISSGFGSRVDPITHGHAVHQGLDFVGPIKEKIISPSAGKVILAGKFSSYGNAIVIDHGFGITTRYGHLSEIKVVEGQILKQGDVIALQGNTGRSTGSHLHYEVRYKNIPLNPRKFLEAGDVLFSDEKESKYVNS